MLDLVLARRASALAVAEVAIFEALAVAVEAALTIVAPCFRVGTLRLWRVVIKELLK